MAVIRESLYIIPRLLFQKLWNLSVAGRGAVAYIRMGFNKMSTSVVLNELPSVQSAHALRGNLFRKVAPRYSISVFHCKVVIRSSSCGGDLWGWTNASSILQPRILAPFLRLSSYWGLAYFLWCIPCYTFSELWAEMNASLAYICNSYSIGNREKYSWCISI
jgi:hypothetical protein